MRANMIKNKRHKNDITVGEETRDKDTKINRLQNILKPKRSFNN